MPSDLINLVRCASSALEYVADSATDLDSEERAQLWSDLDIVESLAFDIKARFLLPDDRSTEEG